MTAYVGADGLHSKVRELAFGTQEKFENHIGFCIAAFILDGYEHRDELATFLMPNRTVKSHVFPSGMSKRFSFYVHQRLPALTTNWWGCTRDSATRNIQGDGLGSGRNRVTDE